MHDVSLHVLKKLRKQHGFTIEDVARFLGFKVPVSYWRIENGKVALKASQLKELSTLYQMPMEKFFIKDKEVVQMPAVFLPGKTDKQLLDLYTLVLKYKNNIAESDLHLKVIGEELERRGIKPPNLS